MGLKKKKEKKKIMGFAVRPIWVQIPALLTVSWLFNLSGLSFLIYEIVIVLPRLEGATGRIRSYAYQ